eukprot:5203490-Pyramimonas_sp.AAC.1
MSGSSPTDLKVGRPQPSSALRPVGVGGTGARRPRKYWGEIEFFGGKTAYQGHDVRVKGSVLLPFKVEYTASPPAIGSHTGYIPRRAGGALLGGGEVGGGEAGGGQTRRRDQKCGREQEDAPPAAGRAAGEGVEVQARG